MPAVNILQQCVQFGVAPPPRPMCGVSCQKQRASKQRVLQHSPHCQACMPFVLHCIRNNAEYGRTSLQAWTRIAYDACASFVGKLSVVQRWVRLRAIEQG